VVAGGPETAGTRGGDELLETDCVLSLVGGEVCGQAGLPLLPNSSGHRKAFFKPAGALAGGRGGASMACPQGRWGDGGCDGGEDAWVGGGGRRRAWRIAVHETSAAGAASDA